MLYIFHVDTGTMMNFDMNYALESVASLKEKIESVCDIPANKQVLLVSGGEVLRPDGKVGAYNAGTDTNPIYMFSKTIIESSDPPRFNCDYGPVETDLKMQIDNCLNLPPSYSTVVSFTQLSQQLWIKARDHTHACENLVHDQHLQQQGWAAVVANMEDVTMDFQERAEDFEKKFQEQLNKKNEYIEFLSRFNEDLDILASIPILPALRLNAVSNPFSAFDQLNGDSESYDDKGEKVEDNEDSQKSSDNASSQSSKGAGGSITSDGDDISKSDRDIQRRVLMRSKSNQNTKEALTLLHWINIKENQESLKHIAEFCESAMEIFEGNVMSTLNKEINEALTSAKKKAMKCINGLEDRLSGLETLMVKARKLEQEQRDLANAFQNQQNAASQGGDMSVLGVLCESLRSQLRTMAQNHDVLRDIRRRCAKAKDELAANLYHRLQWIVYVENRMFETDSRLMFYHRSLSRLKRHLAVVGQLHRAPRLFCTAVYEIVRRRTFSQAFLTWASELACHLLTIHNEEVNRRREFRTLFSGHFLGDLFPGTEDMPPPFATQAPKLFDAELPRLTQDDVNTLTSCLPNIKPEIPPCDMTPVIQFFQSRSGNQDKSSEKQVTDERLLAVVKEGEVERSFESETDTEEFEKVGQSPIERGGGGMQLPTVPMRSDATTLTEVRSHSRQPPIKPPRARAPTPLPLAPIPEAASPHPECDCLLSPSLSSPAALSPRPPSPSSPTAAPGHRADFEPAEFYIEESPPVSLEWGCSASPLDSQTLVSLLQENIGSKQSESENLRETLYSVSNIYSEAIKGLKNDLNCLKSATIEQQGDFIENYQQILGAWERFSLENATREREAVQRLTVDHELEMNDIKELINKKDEEILILNARNLIHKKETSESIEKKSNEINDLNIQVNSLQKSIEELNKKILEAEDVKQKAIKEMQDRIIHDHKAELESLRSRYRLVAYTTNMDRSPSESSLEKIEKTDMIEISNHKTILLQTKEDMEIEKEEALRQALEDNNKEWHAKFADEVEKMKKKHDSDKQVVKDNMKKLLEEKERQIEQYRERELILVKDCSKYKETIQQLTDPETSDLPHLQARICSLEDENRALTEQLRITQEIITRQQTDNPKLDASTSTDSKIKQKMLKGHTPLGLIPKTLSISSCNIGDTVLVLWDGAHSNYTILQESPSLYLLHSDCLVPLDLKLHIKDESERRLYAVGKVENKDYCVAVKSGNKYQVTVGQRFYRIKVRPLKSSENAIKDTAYCCDPTSLKETDSSHKAVNRMTVSDAAGSYDNLSPKNVMKDSHMAKSVCPIPSTSGALRDKFSVFGQISCEVPEQSMTESTSAIQEKQEITNKTIGETLSNFELTAMENTNTQSQRDNNSMFVSSVSVPYTHIDIPTAEDSSKEEPFSEIAEEAAP